MSRTQRIKFGFMGLGLSVVVGAMSVKGRFEPGQVFSTIAGILFFIGAYRAIFSGKPDTNSEVQQPPVPDADLVRRLADIQEIIISIDERLKRIEQDRQVEKDPPAL
jgi:hypothetical protein